MKSLKSKLATAKKAKTFAATYAASTMLALMASPSAIAAQQAKDLAQNITQNISAFKLLLLTFVSLVGLGLFLFGIYLFWKNSNQPGQDHGKKGAMAVIVGIALLLGPFLIGVGAETLSNGQGDTASQAIENDAKF